MDSRIYPQSRQNHKEVAELIQGKPLPILKRQPGFVDDKRQQTAPIAPQRLRPVWRLARRKEVA